MKRLLTGLAIALVLLVAIPSLTGSNPSSQGEDRAPELIVGFYELPEDRSEYKGEPVKATDEDLRFLVVDPEDNRGFQASARSDDQVRYIEENHRDYELTYEPDDQNYSQQYGPQITRTESAWETTLGSTAIKIGFLDSGVNAGHDDLDENATTGWNYLDNSSDYSDNSGCDYHGTHVTGIAAAITDNGEGIAGLSNAEVRMHKIFGEDTTQCSSPSTSEIATALKDLAKEGVHVASNSWGGSDAQAILDAIDYLHGEDVVQVAAAGNYGTCTDCVIEPWKSRADKVIVTSASNEDDRFWDGSSQGPEIDVMAPGVDILSVDGSTEDTQEDDDSDSLLSDGSGTQLTGYKTQTGTSMSAPHVGGAIALYMDAHGHETHDAMEQKVRDAAEDLGLYDERQGAGRLNVGILVSGEDGLVRPIADAQGSCVERDCTLNASATIEGAYPVESYEWTLSDGTTLAGETVNHTFERNGTFTANVTVTTSEGTADKASVDVTGTVVNETSDQARALFDGFEDGKVYPWEEGGENSLWRIAGDTCIEPYEGDLVLSFSYRSPNTYCRYDKGHVIGHVTSQQIQAAAYENVTLSFAHFYEVEDTDVGLLDIMRVQVSDDGGQSFETVARWDARNHTNEDWEEVELNITEYATDRLHIRFHFDSGNKDENGYLGWFIDAVRVTGTLDDAMHVSDINITSRGQHAVFEVEIHDEHEAPVEDVNVTVEACAEDGDCHVMNGTTDEDGIAVVEIRHGKDQTFEACVIDLSHDTHRWTPSMDHAEDGSCTSDTA